MEECYLCCGSEGEMWKPCRCNVQAHPECLHRLLEVPSHATQCAACHYKYDVEDAWAWRFRCLWDGNRVLGLVLAYTGAVMVWYMLILTTNQYRLLRPNQWFQFSITCFLAFMAALSSLGIFLAHYMYVRVTDHACCLGCRVQTRKMRPLCQRV